MCQALYPFMHAAEVALRNGIHQAVSRKFNDENWFEFVVQDGKSKAIIYDLKKELSRKKEYATNDIIASLTFGFWVNLLKQKTYRDQFYSYRLWPDLIPQVFPRYKRSGADDRKDIFQRFEEIKLIRNRLFHHEPIWKFKNAITPSESISQLWKKFNDIYKAIGWISKQTALKEFGFVEFFKSNCQSDVLENYKNHKRR